MLSVYTLPLAAFCICCGVVLFLHARVAKRLRKVEALWYAIEDELNGAAESPDAEAADGLHSVIGMYNEAVCEYNDQISKMPGRIIAFAFNLKPEKPYGEIEQ